MADDRLASQRLDLIAQVATAQLRLEDALAVIRASGDTNALRQGEAQRGELIALRANIATAGPSALVAMRADVMATIAAANASAQRATASTRQADAAALAEARSASREQVRAVMSGMRDFDGQLRFADEDDRRGYRQHEAETNAYIAAQQAKHTPEGDLNASGAAVGLMADAHAHGAHGPEFDKRWNELVATTERLRDAAKANGVSTEEFDRRLRDDLRHIMKSKGLSDAEIDARFAAPTEPLEAAKSYVQPDDVRTLTRSIDVPAAPSPQRQPTGGTEVSSMAEAMAQFRAAGIVTAELTDSSFVHGVTAAEKPANRVGQALPS